MCAKFASTTVCFTFRRAKYKLTLKKWHCQLPSLWGILVSICIFTWFFFYWILVAVNPNFHCLMQCCIVSYSVTLVQIEQKLRKLQPVEYVLRDKTARDSFIMKFLCFFFSFCTQYIFSNNYNCNLNNRDYYQTNFRLCCVQIWWLYIKNLQIDKTLNMLGCHSHVTSGPEKVSKWLI